MYSIKYREFGGTSWKILWQPLDEKRAGIDPILTETVGKAGQLTIDIPESNQAASDIEPYKTILRVDRDGTPYWYGRVITAEADFYNTISVSGEGELAVLNDSILPPYNFTGTLENYFRTLIAAHNAGVEAEKQLTVGVVEVTADSNITRSSTQYPTVYDEIENKLLDVFGGYLRTRHEGGVTYIDYLYTFGSDNEQVLRPDTNMIDYQRKTGGGAFYTRLYPLGGTDDDGNTVTIKSVNQGLDYIDNTALIQRYGIIAAVKTWGTITTPSSLLTRGREDLAAQELPDSFELSAVDLHNINAEIDAFEIGKRTRVISPYHGISAYYFLTRKVSHLDAPEADTINVGEIPKTYTHDTIQQQRQVQEAADYDFEELDDVLDQHSTSIEGLNTSVGTLTTNLQTTTQTANTANTNATAAGTAAAAAQTTANGAAEDAAAALAKAQQALDAATPHEVVYESDFDPTESYPTGTIVIVLEDGVTA